MGYFLGACCIVPHGLWKGFAMRQFIPPLALFLIAIGFWLSDKPSTDTVGSVEGSTDIATADTEVAKKKADTKDSESVMVPDDTFPQKCLTNWKTYEGLLSLSQTPWCLRVYFICNKFKQMQTTFKQSQRLMIAHASITVTRNTATARTITVVHTAKRTIHGSSNKIKRLTIRANIVGYAT